jgi:chemotaxis protein CheD
MLPVQTRETYLAPGDVAGGDASHVFRTTLGSCVSITLWHSARRVGAMSHFLLPSRGKPCHAELDGRYADEAVPLMFLELVRLGVDPTECQAKIFGGGRMFLPGAHAGNIAVGERNGHVARSLLAERGIRTVAEDLFGWGHRELVFEVATGDVWARQVPR